MRVTLCVKRTKKTRYSKQRGDALIEALLAILLAAVVGLGLSYSASRLLNTQRTLNAQNIAFHEMRESMLSKGFSTAEICAEAEQEDTETVRWDDSANYTQNGETIKFTLKCEASSFMVNGEAISLNTIQSIETDDEDANAQDLFGGDGKISLSIQGSD